MLIADESLRCIRMYHTRTEVGKTVGKTPTQPENGLPIAQVRAHEVQHVDAIEHRTPDLQQHRWEPSCPRRVTAPSAPVDGPTQKQLSHTGLLGALDGVERNLYAAQ